MTQEGQKILYLIIQTAFFLSVIGIFCSTVFLRGRLMAWIMKIISALIERGKEISRQ